MLFDEWLKYGRGPLTVPRWRDGLAFIRSPSGKEIELILAPITDRPNVFFISTLMLQPDARGSVKLKSNSSMHPPVMYYGYYNNKNDLKDNIYALKYAVKMVEETQAFKSIAAKLNPIP